VAHGRHFFRLDQLGLLIPQIDHRLLEFSRQRGLNLFHLMDTVFLLVGLFRQIRCEKRKHEEERQPEKHLRIHKVDVGIFMIKKKRVQQ